MSLTKQQALEMFRSDDLIGIGMEADALRRKLHPEGVVTYIIDRNINYTNFCTEYCTFCAFYRPLKGKMAAEGYILDFETIYDKIRETVELGGTGVLMQGGLHPDLKIDWHEKLMRGIKQRFPKVHLHCYSASEIIAIAEYSDLSIRDTILRLRDAGLDSIPGGGAEILDDEVRYKIARLKCLTDDWLNVQSSWVTQGLKVCQMGLRFGGNDVGSVMIEENVVRSAGVTNCTTEEELRHMIRDAGFRPAQRDTLYRTYFLN